MNTLQTLLDEFMKEMDWPYFEDEKIIAKIKEETLEVEAEVVSGDREKLEMETGDLLFAISCFCNKNALDMDTVLKKAIQKNRVRDKDRY